MPLTFTGDVRTERRRDRFVGLDFQTHTNLASTTAVSYHLFAVFSVLTMVMIMQSIHVQLKRSIASFIAFFTASPLSPTIEHFSVFLVTVLLLRGHFFLHYNT